MKHRTASATACMNRRPVVRSGPTGAQPRPRVDSDGARAPGGEGCQGPCPADLAGAGRVRARRVPDTPPHNNADDARSRRRPLDSAVSASPLDARHVPAWSAVPRMHRTASAPRSPSILGRIPYSRSPSPPARTIPQMILCSVRHDELLPEPTNPGLESEHSIGPRTTRRTFRWESAEPSP